MKRVLSVFLAIILFIGIIPLSNLGLKAMAGTNGHTQSEAIAWAEAQTQNPRDYDGTAGIQCPDLIKMYYVYLGYYAVKGNGAAYATNEIPCSTWNRYSYYNGFIPQPGDVACWTYSTSSDGHVAIVLSANSSGMTVAEFLGSNHTGRTHWYSYSYGTLACFIRPDFITHTEPPKYAYISVDKLNYAVNEKVTFHFNTDISSNTNSLFIYCPDGSVLSYPNQGKECELAFGMSGYFEALVQAWNGVGEKCSERISFYIGSPQYAYIYTDKSCYQTNELVHFTFNTAARADYNTLWIYYPDGSSKYYQQVGSSYSLYFPTPGKYKALVEAWNDVGSKCSDKIEFTVGNLELKICYDCYNEYVTQIDTSQGYYFGDYNRLCSSINSHQEIDGTQDVYYQLLDYNSTVGADGLRDFADFGLSAPKGYKFAGWKSGVNGKVFDETSTTYTAADFIDELENGYDHVWLTAQYEPASFIVTFENGNDNITSKTVTYNSSYGDLPIPTRDGYDFLGWFTSADGGEKVESTTIVTATENHTLYAHWSRFGAKEGSTAVIDGSYIYGLKTKLTSGNLKNTFLDSEGVEVTYTKAIEEARYYGTGSTVTVKHSDGTEEVYTIIIFGDVDGNGIIDSDDAYATLAAAVDNSLFDAVQKKAANVDGVRRISVDDYAIINDAVLGISDIDQTAI